MARSLYWPHLTTMPVTSNWQLNDDDQRRSISIGIQEIVTPKGFERVGDSLSFRGLNLAPGSSGGGGDDIPINQCPTWLTIPLFYDSIFLLCPRLRTAKAKSGCIHYKSSRRDFAYIRSLGWWLRINWTSRKEEVRNIQGSREKHARGLLVASCNRLPLVTLKGPIRRVS
jgi:hypothetical protein